MLLAARIRNRKAGTETVQIAAERAGSISRRYCGPQPVDRPTLACFIIEFGGEETLNEHQRESVKIA